MPMVDGDGGAAAAAVVCPITLQSFSDIKYPVVFLTAPSQPYECKFLVRWLMMKGVNPLTNIPVYWNQSLLEIIAPFKNSKDCNIICKYIDAATTHSNSRPRVEKMEAERAVFLDAGFVSACFVLLLLLSFFRFVFVDFFLGGQVLIMILAIMHSLFTTKNVEGHIHLMCGVYVFLASCVVLILGENQSVSMETSTIFIFFLKISSRIVDVYAAQIRQALSTFS